MSHSAATRFLIFSSYFTIALGTIMVLSLISGVHGAMNFSVDLIFFPLNGGEQLTDPVAQLLTAISGGIMLGFGVLCLLVTRDVYAENPALGGRIIGMGLITWFISDSLGSIAAGAWFNVLPNAGFLALFMVPLMLNTDRRQMRAA